MHCHVAMIVQWLIFFLSAFRLENMDFIANCSLSASQLSLSLGEKIDSPNRVISTDSLFAAVIVGMPDCVGHNFLALSFGKDSF